MSINNQVRLNTIEINTQRYKIWEDDEEYEYLDYTTGPEFVGPPNKYTENTTYNGGKTF